jgi:hypothetical protein
MVAFKTQSSSLLIKVNVSPGWISEGRNTLSDTWDSDDGCPVLKSVQFVEDKDNPKDCQFEKRVMKPGRYLPGQEPEEHENYEKLRAGNQAEGAEGSSSKSTKGKKAVMFKVPAKGRSNEVNANCAKATTQAKGKGKTTVEEEVPSKSSTVNAKKKAEPLKSVTTKKGMSHVL